jgi:1,5-anhydro-D-fructose reductase (1,5-anhydro-D-mannitol-forming)
VKIGWGLVGASSIARQRMAGAIRKSEHGEAVALMSHSRPLAQELAHECGIPKVYDSLRNLLADPEIHAVYISSTNQHHHAQVLAAAAAGKHVLCEKPLALSVVEAVEMAAACRKAGVVFGTNHHLRNAVTLRAIRDLIADGAIGSPVAVYAAQPVWCPPEDWRRRDSGKGAGVALDVLVHCADSVRFVLDDEPVSVVAQGHRSALSADGILDTIMATYRFRAGTLAQLHADFNTSHGRTRLDVHGTRGSIFAEDVLGKMAGFTGTVWLRRGDGLEQAAIESGSGRYTRGVNLFNAAIRREGKPACTGADGIRSLAMVLAAEQSARQGRTVEIGADGLEFE